MRFFPSSVFYMICLYIFSDFSRETLSHSHDSVFSESATASSLSIVLKVGGFFLLLFHSFPHTRLRFQHHNLNNIYLWYYIYANERRKKTNSIHLGNKFMPFYCVKLHYNLLIVSMFPKFHWFFPLVVQWVSDSTIESHVNLILELIIPTNKKKPA